MGVLDAAVTQLIVSRYGEMCPIASRIGATLYFTHSWYRSRELYKGLAKTVKSLREVDAPDLILFDHSGDKYEPTGRLADALRHRGHPVWGAGEIQDLLETNRGFGIKVMYDYGVRIPTTVVFDPIGGKAFGKADVEKFSNKIHRVRGRIKEAIEFVKAHKDIRWVMKPFDTASSSLSYVSESADDMESRLRHAEEMGEIERSQRFLLQEFIPGIEISTELWLMNGVPIFPPNATLETKKVHSDDLGPNTGCATSVVYNYPSMDTKIVQETFTRKGLLGWFKDPVGPGGANYLPINGCMDINCIIAEKDRKPYGIEWTPRHGYSAFYAWLQLYKGNLGELFRKLAHGKAPEESFHPGFGYSLRVSIPPGATSDQYVPPTGRSKEELRENWAFAERLMEPAADVRIGGPVDDGHVYLLDAKKSEEGIVTAGADTSIMEIAAQGKTLEEAKSIVDGLFEKIELSDKFARVMDGTTRAEEDMKTLSSWGYEVP